MALTEFGKAIRRARLDADVNISGMAEKLGISAAFLSGVETGRKKVPGDLVASIQVFFKELGLEVESLPQLAAVANKSVPIGHLSPQHQMLVAGFARSSMDAETLKNMEKLLAMPKAKESVIG